MEGWGVQGDLFSKRFPSPLQIKGYSPIPILTKQ